MKKIIYLFVMLFVSQITFAKDNDLLLTEARKFASDKNYDAAIKSYKAYIKEAKSIDLKDVYFEFANCYYKNNDTKMAIKVLKTAVKKHGLTEEDLIYNKILDSNLSDVTIAELYNDFDKLKNKYIVYQEKN